MPRLITIFLTIFFTMGAESAVAAAVDPCTMVGPARMQPQRSRVIIQRDAALRTVIHTKRACKLIAAIETAHPAPSLTRSLGIVAAKTAPTDSCAALSRVSAVAQRVRHRQTAGDRYACAWCDATTPHGACDRDLSAVVVRRR